VLDCSGALCCCPNLIGPRSVLWCLHVAPLACQSPCSFVLPFLPPLDDAEPCSRTSSAPSATVLSLFRVFLLFSGYFITRKVRQGGWMGESGLWGARQVTPLFACFSCVPSAALPLPPGGCCQVCPSAFLFSLSQGRNHDGPTRSRPCFKLPVPLLSCRSHSQGYFESNLPPPFSPSPALLSSPLSRTSRATGTGCTPVAVQVPPQRLRAQTSAGARPTTPQQQS